MAKQDLGDTMQEIWSRGEALLTRHWWWVLAGLIGLIILAGLLLLSWTGNLRTGFDEYIPPQPGAERAKTFWDWIELLLLPAVIAGSAIWYNAQARKREQEAEARRAHSKEKVEERRGQREQALQLDGAREAALQAYFEQMAELLVEGNLNRSEPGAVARDVAQARTLAALRQLDGDRKGRVVRFLYELGLIRRQAIMDLSGADLTSAELVQAELSHVNLAGADLLHANLSQCNLREGNLDGASLRWADLQKAVLAGTTFRQARLGRADLGEANLAGADLSGANLYQAHMYAADLSGAMLTGAEMFGANLGGANLAGANLAGADLQGTNLHGANLREANLAGANLHAANLQYATVNDEQLAQARSLAGAILPNGSRQE
jgi:uncharacterized protein YjbI with pentapeptide repeats